jgi:beta-glucuronidase
VSFDGLQRVDDAGFSVYEALDDASNIADLFVVASTELDKPAPLMTNITGRDAVSLNGEWNIIVDEHEVGDYGLLGGPYFDKPGSLTGMELVEHSFDERRQLRVPGDWNTQDDRLFRYRGVVWYQRDFKLSKVEGNRYYLHFDGVNYFANVYLNGKPLATHNGGYTAFNVDITDAVLDGENFLVVRVDAKLDDSTVPSKKPSDFFKYGGITRDVTLVTVPNTFVRQYHVYLDDLASGTVNAWVQLDGNQTANQSVGLAIEEAGISTSARTDDTGIARFSFEADLSLWSPEQPKLYDVDITLGENTLSDRIGFRTIEVRGQEIFLNDKPVFLRGMSLHDESYLKTGVAYDKADAQAQLGLIKELNGNFVRLAHYPHNEHTVRVADELGLMVWSEIPIVSLIDWDNEETLAIAQSQISDNVHRDLNRASIVIWSIANETTPQSQARLEFLTKLAAEARSIDASQRPLAAALFGDVTREFAQVTKRLVAEMLNDPAIEDPAARAHLQAMADQLIGKDLDAVLNGEIEIMLDDQLGTVVDIVGYNEYFGWYYSAWLKPAFPVDEGVIRSTMFKIMKDIRIRNDFGKPIIISETGAGAKKGYVSDKGPGMIWSEEYQAKVYKYQVDMLSRNDAVQGMTPWILKDFRSAMRNRNGIQEIYNRKGLISDKGEKKQAYFVLKDFYTRKAGQ